jgi:hypothetical protein
MLDIASARTGDVDEIITLRHAAEDWLDARGIDQWPRREIPHHGSATRSRLASITSHACMDVIRSWVHFGSSGLILSFGRAMMSLLPMHTHWSSTGRTLAGA